MPEIYDYAALVGIPFISGGEQTPETGFDCWGLVRHVFREQCVSLPDYRLCPDDDEGFFAQFRAERGKWRRHEWPDAPAPSVAALRFPSVEFVSHVGVYVGGGRFLHTREKTGAVVERVESPAWFRRIEGFYTPKDA